ncbi:Rne/Rng family ribonuclease [Albidovulum sp.]|uniref:Rne/Rng family ribonuclease n=1 Tax=Albidovulum sp. TaxID=1872424 RepID=UPI00352829CE
MAKKMLIDATHAEETRVVVVDGNKVEEFDFETVNKRQLAGNIYLAKITRVEPSLQAAFVDYGGNRHGFLAFSEIHPDYYQIPVADRKALLEEERAYAEALEAEENGTGRSRGRGGSRAKAEKTARADSLATSDEIPGMGVVDAGDDGEADVGAGTDAAAERPADAPVPAADLGAAETGAADLGAAKPDIAVADAAEPEVAESERAEKPYVAADHASDTDADIESVADEDVADEIRQQRKPRPRKYKIQEVVKVRQIMLVQVVKEERGNKGAALTTYLSLAGRYCVLMPNTARGGGISRKITNVSDRKKLKEIAGEIEVPQGAGLIIRTAGSQRTKAEIKRDYEYLMRLWEQIRELTLKSIAPAPIYEEGDLIKRSIRDLYNKDIDEVLVEGERGYRAAKDFMKMIMPSHAKNVKHYHEGLPLFARYQVESYLAGMFNPTVQLRSGGYIVIGVTEALVAIDVNSGRATKEGTIEETALKTNLEAAEEVARQLRLRDLAGLIVIDFIDMEERKNNAAVEKRLKDKLKTDRARIQVGRISGFGLLEMSRQRLRPGMIESTTAPCAHCHGTGIIRSDDSMALQVLRQIEEEGTRKRSREVLVKAPVAVVNFLINQKREHVATIEARYGMAVRIEADPAMVSPDFSMEKFKTATRSVPEPASAVVSVDALRMDEDEDEALTDVEDEAEADEDESPRAEGDQPKKKKRRRRRKKKPVGGAAGEAHGGREGAAGEASSAPDDAPDDAPGRSDPGAGEIAEASARGAPAEAGDKPKAKRSRTRSSSRKSSAKPAEGAGVAASQDAGTAAPVTAPDTAPDTAPAEVPPTASAGASRAAEPGTEPAEKPKRKPSTRSRKPAAPKAAAEAVAAPDAEVSTGAEPAAKPKPARSRSTSTRAKATPKAAAATNGAAESPPMPEPAPAPAPEPARAAAPAPQPDPEKDEGKGGEPKSKRRGWWSLGR